jgi:hypothetical protein
MTQDLVQFALRPDCSVKWAFAGAVEKIRRDNLTGCEPVECLKCGYWHIVTKSRRAAA